MATIRIQNIYFSYPLPGSLHILVAWFWGRIRNSSDVFTNLFQIFLGLKYLQMKTRSCSKTNFSQFANWKRIHNKYGLKKSQIRNSRLVTLSDEFVRSYQSQLFYYCSFFISLELYCLFSRAYFYGQLKAERKT